ncbi:MAG: ATP synthase F1 subunit gamma [Armatimonadetes bacterium]|jgi:F-type H+-transporting ATPase subunit gamma|nr:ATP synthase F1 subunit gamma [Armatimonadota bacterium]
MASTKDIRRRIRVVKNIEKITSAMKMVAAAKLRKAQERAEAVRPYADKMRAVMGNLSASVGEIDHPLLQVREVQNAAYVIIGADRGLAGSYNANVMHKAINDIEGRDAESVKLVLIGSKAISFFRRRRYEIAAEFDPPGSDVTFADIREVTRKTRAMFESGEVDAVYLVYARFVTAMRQDPTVVQLLPMSAPAEDPDSARADYIFEPKADVMLGTLLPRYVDTQLYQAFVESQASEHGARMTAMTAATKNAGEMIDNLTLQYNKARQAAITTEIMEIVSGAEALN